VIFVVHGFDKPGSDLRQDLIAAHRAYMDTEAEVLSSGPLVDDDGETMIGSILIIEAADREAIDKVVAGDPFVKGGVFESLTVSRWYQRVGSFAAV